MNTRRVLLCSALLVAALNSHAQNNPFDPRRLEHMPIGRRPPQQATLRDYPLAQLRMVGTLITDHQRFALILDPEHRVYLLIPGKRIGQEQGEIQRIEDDSVWLQETVTDVNGRQRQRNTHLYLETP